MEQNVGMMDKAGRLALAAILFGMAWHKPGKIRVLAAFEAGMLTMSAASGYCPLYKVIGMNTACSSDQSCCSDCS